MAFKIELQPSGHSFEVPPDKTVLLAGLEAGFYMPYSCRVGTCRTCRGTIKSGRVDYGDVHPTYLPDIDKAKGYVLCCQARPPYACRSSTRACFASSTLAPVRPRPITIGEPMR